MYTITCVHLMASQFTCSPVLIYAKMSVWILTVSAQVKGKEEYYTCNYYDDY